MFVFFNDTATTEIYTLSLHDALPILLHGPRTTLGPPWSKDHRTALAATIVAASPAVSGRAARPSGARTRRPPRSEEHTSELQSRQYLVCRLLLEKKK